ncbi:two-component system response regulator [Agromyces badenianii]|nr:two-component system response regulator [Agromyces badenianii]
MVADRAAGHGHRRRARLRRHRSQADLVRAARNSRACSHDRGHDRVSQRPQCCGHPTHPAVRGQWHDVTSAASVTVVIADDHELFRDGLRAMLTAADGVRVVGEAATHDQAYERVLATRPDVLLLDVEMPGIPVLSTISRVRAEAPATRILIVTMHRDRVLANHLRAAGAAGFVSKSAPASELVDAIHAAIDVPDPIRRPELVASVLSLREKEVMRLIAQGLSNDEIGRSLSISVGTVKRHNTNIFSKLGATSRTDAVRKASRLGEIQSP